MSPQSAWHKFLSTGYCCLLASRNIQSSFLIYQLENDPPALFLECEESCCTRKFDIDTTSASLILLCMRKCQHSALSPSSLFSVCSDPDFSGIPLITDTHITVYQVYLSNFLSAWFPSLRFSPHEQISYFSQLGHILLNPEPPPPIFIMHCQKSSKSGLWFSWSVFSSFLPSVFISPVLSVFQYCHLTDISLHFPLH